MSFSARPFCEPLPAEFGPWLEELPSGYEHEVIVPRRFELHEDAPAHARTVVGLDAHGERCYLRHAHTEVQAGFDIDECPQDRPLAREDRVAWRLLDGRWLHRSERTERLQSCRPRHLSQPPQLWPRLVGF